jgi:hypothetical protein
VGIHADILEDGGHLLILYDQVPQMAFLILRTTFETVNTRQNRTCSDGDGTWEWRHLRGPRCPTDGMGSLKLPQGSNTLELKDMLVSEFSVASSVYRLLC